MNNLLTFTNPSFTIDNSNIFGGINYIQNINPDVDLTIGTVSSAEVSFVTDVLNKTFIGKEFTYSQDENTKGVFTVIDVQKTTDNKYSIKAYDNVIKLDADITDYISSLSGNKTVKQLFSGVCTYLGLTASSSDFTNSSISFNIDLLKGSNYTGRQILEFVANIAGGFIIANSNGTITVKQFGTTSTTAITNEYYSKLVKADYIAPTITKVKVSTGEDDIGISVGSGDTVLDLGYNPIIYSLPTLTITAILNNILSVVSNFSYKPMTFDVFEDCLLECGDLVNVDDEDTYVFSINSSSKGYTYSSTGNSTREVPKQNIESTVLQTKGQYHNLKVDVDQLTSEIGGVEGSVTTLSQRCDGIELSVAGKLDNDGDDVIAAINIAPGEVKISANKVNIEGEFVTFDDLSTSGSTTINGANISTGTINANRLGLTGVTSSGDEAALVVSRTNSPQYKVSVGNHSVKAESGTNSYCYMDETGIHGHYGNSGPYVEIYTGYSGTNPSACYIDPAVNTKNYYKDGTNLDDVYAAKTHYHSEYVQHTQLPGKFSVQSKAISISNLTANSSQTNSASIARTGYTPIGVVGTQVNNGGLVINAAYISGTTLNVRYRNVMANTDIITATGTIYVLYISN